MRHLQEFSRFAKEYAQYNQVQNQVSKDLLAMLKSRPNSIIDIGCGSGTLYKNIDWPLDAFYALDYSKEMLDNHPTHNSIIKRVINFDENNFLLDDEINNSDLILSSASLQWSKDLEKSFAYLASLNKPMALSLFTSATFGAIHQFSNTKSPIYKLDYIEKLANKYFNVELSVKRYKKEFENNREMFKYLKKSGVSGASKSLGFKQTKRLIEEFPLNYLEFEVLFIVKE